MRFSSRTSATSKTILRWRFFCNPIIYILLLLVFCVGIFLLDSNWSSDVPQFSPFADIYTSRHLQSASFGCFQILNFQLKRRRLLSFLFWSLPQCDFWTFFREDLHHVSGVNLSSPSRDIFTWIFSKTLSLVHWWKTHAYLSVLIGQRHLVSWPGQHYQVLDFILICWNEKGSLPGRCSWKSSFPKKTINFDILYLYHSSWGTSLNLLIASSLSDEWLWGCCTGSWWGRRRITSLLLSRLAHFGMFSLPDRGKVVFGETLTPSPIAVFVIHGRIPLNWVSTLFSFRIVSATVAQRCVNCYYSSLSGWIWLPSSINDIDTSKFVKKYWNITVNLSTNDLWHSSCQ